MSETPVIATEPLLTIQQVRVLACLMEKHLATPKNYPLSANSLQIACNQKSNRGLVMDLSIGQVEHTASELESLDYVRMELGDRAKRFSHRGPAKFKIDRHGQAILAMLMLREPLTLVEIMARTERLANCDDLEHVKLVTDDLVEREVPLAILIPKGPGQREDRYTHLLNGTPNLELIAKHKSHTAKEEIAILKARVAELELELQTLKDND
ncbi:MAG: hypothetical protein ACI9FR_001457 [Cryomorphaceae bacterium]|jgi:uncharacterized protein YceH (UPF0502 family)